MKGRPLLIALSSLLGFVLVAGLITLVFTTLKLQQALKPKPVQYSAAELAKRANDQITSGDYAQAEEYLKQSLQKQDDHTYRSKLAVVEYRLKKYADSITQYQLLVDKQQDVAFAENGIGNAQRDWGSSHYADAEAAYRSSFAADKGYVAAYSNLALLLTQEHQLPAAIKIVEQGIAVTEDPSLISLKATLSK